MCNHQWTQIGYEGRTGTSFEKCTNCGQNRSVTCDHDWEIVGVSFDFGKGDERTDERCTKCKADRMMESNTTSTVCEHQWSLMEMRKKLGEPDEGTKECVRCGWRENCYFSDLYDLIEQQKAGTMPVPSRFFQPTAEFDEKARQKLEQWTKEVDE